MSDTTSTDRTPVADPDVCVIGAGVAGALVANSLSGRGYDVVVLEAGPRFEPEDRQERLERALRPESPAQDVWEMGGERDRYTSSGDLFYPLNQTRVKGVGGTTLTWLGITPRLHEKDFEVQSRHGVASDWPIRYRDLQPYYRRAERALGVSGSLDNPFAPPRETEYPMDAFPPSYSDSLFQSACDELGITMHSVPQARNSEVYDGRSQCLGYSTCIKVCPSGAKYSGDVHIRKSEGNEAIVIDRVPVQRLEHDTSGTTVEAAVYATPDGTRHRQTARRFVLAAGAIETPRLLLLSDSEKHPDGLANSSGVVGKYLMDHPIVSINARLDEPANQEPIGFHTSECHQFYDDPDNPPGSIKLVFLNKNPTRVSTTALRGGDGRIRENFDDIVSGDPWGDELAERLREYYPNRRVGMIGNPEPLPRQESQVTLDTSQTDEFGNPVPNISWNLGSYARTTMEYIRELQRSIMEEMGATVTAESDLSDPDPGSHPMGTTRMGADPDESVVNPRLRTHDVQNLYIASSSVFVTGGALNPTLTIAALSLKAADHIAADLE
jgi:choline dehydrogenase-like flavoprotein